MKTEPTVTEALVNVVEASHKLVANRVDSALAEVRHMVDHGVGSAAMVLVGALVLAGALIALDVALVELVAIWAPRAAAYGVCALFNAVLGGALVWAGLRRKERT